MIVPPSIIVFIYLLFATVKLECLENPTRNTGNGNKTIPIPRMTWRSGKRRETLGAWSDGWTQTALLRRHASIWNRFRCPEGPQLFSTTVKEIQRPRDPWIHTNTHRREYRIINTRINMSPMLLPYRAVNEHWRTDRSLFEHDWLFLFVQKYTADLNLQGLHLGPKPSWGKYPALSLLVSDRPFSFSSWE